MSDDLDLTPKAHPVVPEGCASPARAPEATERSSTFSAIWRKFQRGHWSFTPKQLAVGVSMLVTFGWTASQWNAQAKDQVARLDRTEQLVKWQTRAMKALARHDGVTLPPMPGEDESTAPLLGAPISMQEHHP